MSNSGNERMAELEEKVKRLQENNEAWRKTVATLNRIVREKEEEIYQLKKKIELVRKITEL